MPDAPPRPAPLRRLLAALDAACDRLYGWRGNPFYQSGTVAVLMLVVLIVTGLWLLLFYRVGAPYDSVARLTADPWTGNWVRGLHRYASDAAVVATAVHALRMGLQGRAWGPRLLAWVSGVVLTGVILLLGWTGYVLVWDTFGEALAVEGARLLDALPVLSEPIGRAFTGDRPVPNAFFFLNLFMHVALPLLVGLLLWLHVSRVARAVLLPPRALRRALVGALTAVAVLWPLPMAPAADPLRLPAAVPADWFYAFWLPVTRALPAGVAWLAVLAAVALLLAVPWFLRPARLRRPPPSVVDRHLCTGCEQCALDCPWDAIRMETRTDGREGLVAHVEPARCVSCGICAASCAPMGVGPAGRTGRDQLAEMRAFMADPARRPGEVVVAACAHGPGQLARAIRAQGAAVFPVQCAGNLHTSTVEYAVRRGAGGVLVLACPPRDCWNREGVVWLEQRLFHEREAELKARVDRRRVRLACAGAGERRAVLVALAGFQRDVAALERPRVEAEVDVDTLCAAAEGAEP